MSLQSMVAINNYYTPETYGGIAEKRDTRTALDLLHEYVEKAGGEVAYCWKCSQPYHKHRLFNHYVCIECLPKPERQSHRVCRICGEEYDLPATGGNSVTCGAKECRAEQKRRTERESVRKRRSGLVINIAPVARRKGSKYYETTA